jgi:hypothetical protein
MAFIKDLVLDLKRKLANREDSEEQAPFFLRDAIRELTDNYPFPELEVIGPERALTATDNRYGIGDFTNAGEGHTDITLIKLWTNHPDNTKSTVINWREPRVVAPLMEQTGMPSFFTRFGQEFILGPTPDKSYQVQMWYQRKHPFSITREALLDDEVLMPESWLEIIVYAAALRAATELRLPDYVTLYHAILFGDPENPQQLGLIDSRMAQRNKDKRHNPGQMMPIVRRI